MRELAVSGCNERIGRRRMWGEEKSDAEQGSSKRSTSLHSRCSGTTELSPLGVIAEKLFKEKF